MIPRAPIQRLKRLFGVGAERPTKKPLAFGGGNAPKSLFASNLWGEYYQRQMRLAADRLQRMLEFDVMDEDDLPASVLDLYAEDATQMDHASGRSVWVTGERDEVVQAVETFYDDVMQVEDHVFGLSRDVAKYGEAYEGPVHELLDDGGPGRVVATEPLDPRLIIPQVKDGQLIGYRVGEVPATQSGSVAPGAIEPPWSLFAFRLLGRERIRYTGSSVLYPARRPYRRLRLVEDALAIYRLRMAPDRLVFRLKGLDRYSPEEKRMMLEEVRNEVRRKALIDSTTGEFEGEVDPFTVDDDFYIDEAAMDVSKLPGTTDIGRILDVDYHRKRFCGAVRVPPDYVGFSDARASLLGQSSLCFQDVQFARTVRRIQRAVLRGLTRAAQVDMVFRGLDPFAEDQDFVVHMAPISHLEEKMRAETAKIRADVVDVLMDAGEKLGMEKEGWRQYVLAYSGLGAEPVRLFQGRAPEEFERVRRGCIGHKQLVEACVAVERGFNTLDLMPLEPSLRSSDLPVLWMPRSREEGAVMAWSDKQKETRNE